MSDAGSSAGPASVAAVPLVGRDRELAILVGLLDAVRQGRGGIALVGGEAGIGKTRLLDELVEATSGVAYGIAACVPEEQPAFWVWRRVLDEAARRASHDHAASLRDAARSAQPEPPGPAEPASATGPFGDERLQRIEQVRRHLVAPGAGEPVVLVLDDLHWADAPSVRLLAHLMPDLHRSPVLVVGAYRSDEVAPGSPLADLAARGGGLHQVALRGLQPGEVARVAAAFAGIPTEALQPDDLYAATGGNPLFARELGRLLGDQIVGTAERPVPPSLRAVIERRLGRLPAEARLALDAAAVGGASVTVAQLAGVVGTEPAPTLDVLDHLAGAGLLSPGDDPGSWTFTHALIRQTAHDALGSRRRAELHRAWAHVLEDQPDQQAVGRELARHYRAAVPLVPADQAARHVRRAGEDALRGIAYEEAVRHLTDAMALHRPSDPAELTECLLVLGDAQYRAGERTASEATFAEAVALAGETGRPDQLARAALGYGAGPGGFEIVPFHAAQVEALEAAVAALPDDDGPQRARVLARLSVAGARTIPLDRRERLARDAVAIARRLDDPRLLAYALSTLCDAVAGPDHVDERLRHAGEMLALSARARDREMELLARRLRVVAHLERGDDASFRSDLRAYALVAERLRDPLYGWYAPFFAGTEAMNRGAFEEAAAHRREAAEIGRRASSYNAELLVAVQENDQLFLQGRYAEMVEHWFAFTARYPDMQRLAAYGPLSAAMRALAGDASACRQLAASVQLDHLDDDSEWLASVCWMAMAAALGNDAAFATRLYPRLLPHRARFAVDGIAAGCFGSVEGWLAPLADLLGDTDAARAHRAAAVTANRRAGLPLVADAVARHGTPWLPPEPAEGIAPVEHGGRGGRGRDVAVLRRRGDHWEVIYDARQITVRDSKGLQDLSVLLRRPGVEVAAIDLAATDARREHRPRADTSDEILDAAARSAYRDRITELQAELDEADAIGDGERSATAKAELDILVAELAAATGLAGSPRRTTSGVERARKAVSARITDAVGRFERLHPPLARHLRNSVRTGTYCSYRPERPVDWTVDAG